MKEELRHIAYGFQVQEQRTLVIVSLFICALMGATTAYAINSASEGYQLTTSAQRIDLYGTCYMAQTTGGSNVFFPTKTQIEWNAFVAHHPSNVSLSACAPTCSGVSYGGYCWYSSIGGQSCDTACSAHGGANLNGTRNYAGSGGTLAQCGQVASALGLSYAYLTDGPNGGIINGTNYKTIGCIYQKGVGAGAVLRITAEPTDTSTSYPPGSIDNRRICACNN